MFASDWALLALLPGVLLGWKWTPREHATDPPHLRWVAAWFLVLLAISVSATGQGWLLQFAPQRCLVLLGVPMALLAAAFAALAADEAASAAFAAALAALALAAEVSAGGLQAARARTDDSIAAPAATFVNLDMCFSQHARQAPRWPRAFTVRLSRERNAPRLPRLLRPRGNCAGRRR